MSEVILTAPSSGLYSYNEEIFFELSKGDKYVGLPKVQLDALRVRVDELEKENQELKAKLEKAESVISFYANKRHWDYTRIQMVEDMEMHGFGNLGGRRARE